MMAFPEFSPRKARNGKLLLINCNNFDFCPVQEQVKFSACRFAAARFHNDGRLQSVCSRQQTSFRFAEQPEKLPSFRLPSRIASTADVSITTGTAILG